MHGLLISQMDPPVELDDEFHTWYDTEHIPVRLALSGFGSAVRYRATENATRFLVCYFIDNLDVLESDAYERIKSQPGPRTERMLGVVRDFTRFTCEMVNDTGEQSPSYHGPSDHVIVHVSHCLPGATEKHERREAARAEFLVESDHRWQRVRSYRTFGANVGGPWTHISIHEVSRPISGPSPVLGSSGVEQEQCWNYEVIRRSR
ncbi:MAG: hypothetical protein ACI83Y_000286 [Candidatus Azotimanducaceae bacterium]|jgi:hypothetical protein|tara:strand:- start:742 stop:1356 length:615 start_codon:yes stop_codon:yes gene_type:complete